ncbi:MAG TPA: hypothetical protein VFX02_10660 [Gammaproteobacteria bacterium]|nr:hypothetical protein [Gammaproteobacteria bacterium]
MESVLVSLVVTFVFLVLAGVIGHKLEKRPRPYGFLIPAVHIVLFLLVLSGVFASIYKLQLLPAGGGHALTLLYVAVLTLLVNLAVGLAMLFIKGKSRILRKIHKISTYAMAASVMAGIIFVSAAIY